MYIYIKIIAFIIALIPLISIVEANNFNSIHINSKISINQRKSIKLSDSLVHRCIVRYRGGISDEDKPSTEEKSEFDELVEDSDEDNDDEETTTNKINNQNAISTYITDIWKKTPPITQIYVGSSMILTLLSFILNKNVYFDILNLDWSKVIQLQLWRPITAFFFFGPLGLNYLLTIQFVWTYMAQLEKLNYKKPEDYLTMILFGAVALTFLYTILGFSTKFLGHNLSTYLVYIWARLFEGSEVNVMDLFYLKAELLPWFFCAQTFLLEGELPFADMLGIVVGHLYHYLTKQNILKSPQILTNLFNSKYLRDKYIKFKDDFE